MFQNRNLLIALLLSSLTLISCKLSESPVVSDSFDSFANEEALLDSRAFARAAISSSSVILGEVSVTGRYRDWIQVLSSGRRIYVYSRNKGSAFSLGDTVRVTGLPWFSPYDKDYFGYPASGFPNGATIELENNAFDERFPSASQADFVAMERYGLSEAQAMTYPQSMGLDEIVAMFALQISGAQYIQMESYTSPVGTAPWSFVLSDAQTNKPAGFYNLMMNQIIGEYRREGIDNLGFSTRNEVPISFVLQQEPLYRSLGDGVRDLLTAADWERKQLREACPSLNLRPETCEEYLANVYHLSPMTEIPFEVAFEMVKMGYNTSLNSQKPIAIYLMRNENSEGSFSDFRNLSYLNRTHRVFVYRVSTDTEATDALRFVGQAFGNISLVVLAAHGNADGMMLSPGDQRHWLDKNDIQFFATLSEYARNATVLLSSCSTAATSSSGSRSFAAQLAIQAAQVKEVIAATQDSAGTYINFNNGRLNVYFRNAGRVRYTYQNAPR